METANYAQITKCFIYFISIILSSTFFIPMIFNLKEFQGNCLLFTTGVFNESDGRIFEPKWSNFSYCALTLINGNFLILISLFQFYRTFRLARRGMKGSIKSIFWESFIAIIAFVFTMIDAILVTVGFNKFCNSLSQSFESCEDAADSNVLIIQNTTINPEQFFWEIGTVSFGIWFSLIAWFFIFVISSIQFYEHHQKENLIISMARERRRYQTISETIDE